MKHNLIFFGFGLKQENWIDNPNPKSNFDFGLSITIQSTKLDSNPDWAIQQSNPVIPCWQPWSKPNLTNNIELERIWIWKKNKRSTFAWRQTITSQVISLQNSIWKSIQQLTLSRCEDDPGTTQIIAERN